MSNFYKDILRKDHKKVFGARELLKYSPVVDFKEGLRRTVDWYKQNAK